MKEILKQETPEEKIERTLQVRFLTYCEKNFRGVFVCEREYL